MLSVIHAECHIKVPCAECRYADCHYAECRYAECRYAECRYAECRYAECHGATVGATGLGAAGSVKKFWINCFLSDQNKSADIDLKLIKKLSCFKFIFCQIIVEDATGDLINIL
jgi:hypothetical protein